MSNGGSLRISTAANEASGRVCGFRGAVPVVVIGGDFDATHTRLRHRVAPEKLLGFGQVDRVPPRLQGTHHRNARVLVGLQPLGRIDDERKFHRKGSESGAPIVP